MFPDREITDRYPTLDTLITLIPWLHEHYSKVVGMVSGINKTPGKEEYRVHITDEGGGYTFVIIKKGDTWEEDEERKSFHMH